MIKFLVSSHLANPEPSRVGSFETSWGCFILGTKATFPLLSQVTILKTYVNQNIFLEVTILIYPIVQFSFTFVLNNFIWKKLLQALSLLSL